jgi:TonB family protein
MSNTSHNNSYSAEDIQNYLSGRLSPLQMNAMERAALDDPFLAEAMEGYAAMQTDAWKKQLGALKQSFAQPQTGAKIIPLTKKKNSWWKAAAAVLVIGGTATLGYIFFNKEDKPEIAQNTSSQKIQADTASPLADAVQQPESAPESNTATVTQNTPVKENRTIVKDITHAPAEAIAESAFVYTPPKTQPAVPGRIDAEDKKVAEDVAIVTKPSPQAPASTNAANNGLNNINAAEGYGYNKSSNAEYEALFKKKADAGNATTRQETKLNKAFFAQVVGADNSPLPFANVNIKSENFGTYADVKGNFRLLSNDSVLTVEVRSAGFKPQLVTLKSNVQQNRIILSEDNANFAEKTVISSSSTARTKVSRRAVVVTDSIYNVEPADGWDNYNTYVDNNIEIPDDILKNNIHGQVELSFDVKSNGAITNIKVDKSLCNNCDEAAIRMLQQGPQWKVKKGKKGKGKITVRF